MKNRLKTSINKGPFIFAIVGLALSIALILVMALTDQDKAIRIIVYVFCSIFSAIALFLILALGTCYVEAKDEELISVKLFIKSKIKLSSIKEVIYKDNVYTVYKKSGKKFTTFSAYDPIIPSMIGYLEKKGVKVH